MLYFLNQPLSGTASLILAAVLAAVSFAAIKLGHKKARDISRQFLAEHPNAAALYLYSGDLPSNSAELSCTQGTVSKVYDGSRRQGAKGCGLPCAARKGGAQCYDHMV